MGKHPALVYYGDTASAGFDLVLFVGREPNDDSHEVGGLGTYDFAKSPRCAFWNGAYGLFAKQSDRFGKTAAFKRHCAERRASPIVISDALPFTLKHSAVGKARAREAVDQDAIRSHVKGVLSHKPLVGRIKTIVLSGLQAPVFETSRNAYREMSRSMIGDVEIFETAFLYPTNTRRIMTDLGTAGHASIAKALRSFSPEAR